MQTTTSHSTTAKPLGDEAATHIHIMRTFEVHSFYESGHLFSLTNPLPTPAGTEGRASAFWTDEA